MDRHPAAPSTTQHLLTATLDEEHPGMFTDHVDTLHLVWRACRDRYPFTMTAGVILPDHLHCIVALPAGEKTRTARWRLLRELFEHVVYGHSAGIRMDERPLMDEAEVQRQIDYVHADPVRHGLVRSPHKWPYSSLHAYIERGLRPMYWTGEVEGGYGTRVAGRASSTPG
jgi:REP-associated tyrosine transposase